MSAEQQ